MTRRSRPPVYRGKNINRKPFPNGRKHWKKQKAATVLHFRRQHEEEIALLEDNIQHTYVYEFVTEDNNLIITEDGQHSFYYSNGVI